MQASRPAGWRRSSRRGAIAWGVITLTAMFGTVPAGLAQPGAGHPNPDWPCRQILVGRLSVAAVWAGPSIEGIAWRNEEPIADIVAKLAARRTPVEDAERTIEDFARSQGAGKTKKLIAVFAGLFETLNDERTQVIEGLLRFGAKQKELADKIRAENAMAREGPGKKPDTSEQDAKTVAQDLEWDLRVFDERRQSLTYVCETPTLIEQRLFALAKVIQRNLE
ncbi:MAG: hypothetical protein WBV25_07690 [Methylocella sp.]